MKILAAIVTYNRCDLLARCIDHVQSQSRPPESLVVINNGSTDGTLAMLTARGVPVITQENVGSAGGWHRAIQEALDGGFDAVWLMDDDGYPDSKALAHLECALVPEVACVSSIVLQEDRPDQFVFPFTRLDSAGLPVIFGFPRKFPTVNRVLAYAEEGIYPFAYFFNGALVSMAAVRKVGNINQDFFMFGEEVDYFFRLRKVGKVLSLLSAKHYHPDVNRRPYTPTKVYYYVKNTLILNARYFNWVWFRHGMTLLAVLARTARRNGVCAALSYVMWLRAPLFYLAVVRGLRGQVGQDFHG